MNNADELELRNKINYRIETLEEELFQIIKRTSKVLKTEITDDAAYELAKRSRGTPRIANRLFKRVRDFALVLGNGNIDLEITKDALSRLKVDPYGLDNIDIEYLKSIAKSNSENYILVELNLKDIKTKKEPTSCFDQKQGKHPTHRTRN